jgi:hypothetical protein
METLEIELDQLKKRAELVGCYVNRHAKADPMGGDLYLMPRRSQRDPHPPSIVRYGTVEQIEATLTAIEQETLNHAAQQ